MSKVFTKIIWTLEALGRILLKALVWLFPRDRGLIVFGAWAGKQYDDNARTLYEYVLSQRPRFRCVWHTGNPAVLRQLQEQGMPVARIQSLRGWWNICRAGYIVHTDAPADYGWACFASGATLVNLWHGVGPKRFGKDVRQVPSFLGRFLEKAEAVFNRQYYISTSDAITERYVRVFGTDRSHILCLGQARNDLFYQPHVNPLRERFPGKRIIVYMPTFREEGHTRIPMDLDSLLDLPAIESFCRKYGMIFLVKFHPWTLGHLSAGYEHIVELSGNSLQVQMILDATDILLTDYSSCFVDHLLLDRPQLFYAYDLENYMAHGRDLYGDFRADATGRICQDFPSLMEELENIAQGKDAYSGKRKEIRDFYYNPENQGPVAGKQADAILSL